MVSTLTVSGTSVRNPNPEASGVVVEVGPVLVDHRERESGIPEALVAAGLDVQLTDLPWATTCWGSGSQSSARARQT